MSAKKRAAGKVTLSGKALRFVLAAAEFKLAADRKRLEKKTLSVDERADLGNDTALLEEVRKELADSAG